MSRSITSSERGTVVLVALGFVTILGIAVAGYLSVCVQAMRLSHQAFGADVSRQLAEMGLERGLRAFNRNDWSGWTLSGTTATRTITFPADKFGSVGLTGSIKLRVDNYNAYHLGATWSSSTAYVVGDVVGYNGAWYRCIITHNATTALPPNSPFWMPELESTDVEWNSATSYQAGGMARRNSVWYRCISAHTNQPPPNVAYWVVVPAITFNTPLVYSTNALVYYYGNWYQWNGASWSGANPAGVAWIWRNTTAYSVGDIVYRGGVWYRCTTAHTNNAPPNASFWSTLQPSGEAIAAKTWSSSTTYRAYDVVYRAGSWYRALQEHANQQPPNPTYWANTPSSSHHWRSGRTYPANSVVLHNGVWYRNTASTSNHPTLGPWLSAETSTWNSATAYGVNSYVSYGGVWYRCIAAHTNQSPNKAAYWQATNAAVLYAEGRAAQTGGKETVAQLRATIVPGSLFPNAIAATETVSFGTTVLVDSYDSTAGTYNAGSAGFSAVVAGAASSGTAVTLSSATVKGYVAATSSDSSPYAPRVSYAGSASVRNPDGSVTSPAAGAVNVDLTRLSRSPYIPSYEASMTTHSAETLDGIGDWPAGGMTIGTPGAQTPTIYDYDEDNDGEADGMYVNNQVLTVIGPVVLNVGGQLRIRSNASSRIVITETGSLQINFTGRLRIQNGGGIQNQTLDPKKLTLVGTGSHTNHDLQSTANPFYGTLYLPNGRLQVAANMEIFGAVSAKNVTFGNNAKLHYDTSLRYTPTPGTESPYVIREWRELSAVAEQASF
ncbi:MAG: hypothetical protein KIT44_03620 [Opitutaceae bacterium]|nr:hypothetical protein [Opitutaceae bacterium]